MEGGHTRPLAAAVVMVTAMVMTLAAAATCRADLEAIEVAPGGRHLQQSDGTPFFWMADTAWRLYRLDAGEVATYLDDRVAKGFNVIQGPVLLGDNPNHAGVANPDPGRPSEAWFAHIDTILDLAEARGLYVAPVLAWGSHADRFDASSADAYGRFVAARYRDRTNIAAWIVAGEYNHPDWNVPTWTAVAEGLSAEIDGAHLITIHPKWFGGYGSQSSSGSFHDAGWLAFNMIQSSQYGDCTNDPGSGRYLGTHNWLLVENDYAFETVKPTLDAEPTYEQMRPGGPPHCDQNPARWGAFGVRRRAYWSVFAGGFGHAYGANGVFQFHAEGDAAAPWFPIDTWEGSLAFEGASDMGNLRSLVESRPMLRRRPGQDLLVPGPDGSVPGHVHAARDVEGQYAFVYVPGPGRTVTIDMTLLAGESHLVWCFDPRDGSSVLHGFYAASDHPGGTLELATPDTGEDWVLVIDDADADFPAPGTSDDVDENAGDVNGDDAVNILDLVLVIVAWGPNPGHPADLNGDGVVNALDALIIVKNWQVP